MVDLVFDGRMAAHSGIGTYCQALLPAMAEHFNCRVVGDPVVLEPLVKDTGQVIPCESPIYSLREQWELPRRVPETRIFWSPHYNVPVLPIRASRRMVTVHDVFHLAFSGELSLAERLYSRWMFRAAGRKSDRIITVSEFSKNEIIRFLGVPPGKISVIHNGLQPGFVPDPGDISNPYDFPYLLYVGNVKPHKNLIVLVKAFLASREEHPELRLLIVGKKDGFITGDDRIEQYAARHPEILFTGYLESDMLRRIYRDACMLVVPSRYEGFGYPLIEGMHSHVPVLASDIPVFREVAGDAACYFDPESPGELANRIESLMTNAELRNRLVAEGARRLEKFTHRAFVENHLELIESML